MAIEFKNVDVNIKGKNILSDVSLKAEDKKITGIVGPNGSGKSTLIKTFFSIVRHQRGEIFLGDQNINQLSKKEIAKQVSYIGQENNPQFDFTVEEVVKMGRYPHGSKEKNINDIINEALEVLQISHFSKRNIRTLSGGERKLTYLARSIAQNTQYIILDEPTNHLDIKHQYMIMNYLRMCGKTVLVIIHDINLAIKFCDQVYIMKDGKVYMNGCAQGVFTAENMKEVFEVDGMLNVDNVGNSFFTVTS